MNDSTGWPILEGARARVEYPGILRRAHRAGCLRIECACPVYPLVRNGQVRRVVESPATGRPFVEVVEYETFNVLTPSPANVRIMRGKTNAARRHALLTQEGVRSYRRRKRDAA